MIDWQRNWGCGSGRSRDVVRWKNVCGFALLVDTRGHVNVRGNLNQVYHRPDRRIDQQRRLGDLLHVVRGYTATEHYDALAVLTLDVSQDLISGRA